jgi:hypothetical protein
MSNVGSAMTADLVLEDGGVKGIGLVGALWTKPADKLVTPSLSGTSRGALRETVLDVSKIY